MKIIIFLYTIFISTTLWGMESPVLELTYKGTLYPDYFKERNIVFPERNADSIALHIKERWNKTISSTFGCIFLHKGTTEIKDDPEENNVYRLEFSTGHNFSLPHSQKLSIRFTPTIYWEPAILYSGSLSLQYSVAWKSGKLIIYYRNTLYRDEDRSMRHRLSAEIGWYFPKIPALHYTLKTTVVIAHGTKGRKDSFPVEKIETTLSIEFDSNKLRGKTTPPQKK